ncbi:MAG TPA: hypothetical protein VG247_35720 [Pseudonocardiaceae bacterium]|nr:hypothetical protein [Pseudonocardiaceae bacterium]
MRFRRMLAALVGVAAISAAVALAPAALAAPANYTVGWGSQAVIPGVGGSSDAPALTDCYEGNYDGVYMMWKGAGSDQRLFFNKMDVHGNWGNQVALPFGGSSTEPSIACGNNLLMAVWKGIGTDERIFYSISSDGGATWTPQEVVDGAPETDLTPTVDWLPGAGIEPYLVWKGVGSDDQVYYSAWDGAWSTAGVVPGAATDTPPRATYHIGGFGVVWKGLGSPNFWMQRLGDAGWDTTATMIVADGGSSTLPGLTGGGPGGGPLMVWKGVGTDQRVFYTSGAANCGDATLPQCWNPQQLDPTVGGTSGGPDVAEVYLQPPNAAPYSAAVLVWKGAGSDQRLFYSIGALPQS